MRYLVTGGSGYLGSHLVYELLNQDHTVVVFDDYSGGLRTVFPSGVSQIIGSITSTEDIKKLNELGPFDGIFHLAAKKSVHDSATNPEIYWKTNVDGTRNILEFCVEQSIPNFVFTSSAAVYGALDVGRMINESDLINPINVYGQTKQEAEKLVYEFANANQIATLALRCFNLAGAKDVKLYDKKGENVIPIIMRCIQNKETFQIFGTNLKTLDGTCIRDYINVLDAANAHIAAMKFLEHSKLNSVQILNISSGIGTSVNKLIELASEYSGREVTTVAGLAREGDPTSSIGDPRLANQLLAWAPSSSIQKIVEESLKAYKF
jgi:UDP-glucose 4-epimerase